MPYFVYLDIVFHTFFENTFDPADFQSADLRRIYDAEAEFLEGAAGVFFESAWGLEKARSAYGLSGAHYHAVGRGGGVEPPPADVRQEGLPFLLTVAMRFEQKGGDRVLAAFRELRREFPQLRWHVVGGPPTGDWRNVGGIVHEGVLDPERPADLARFRELLSQAFLLVHPTREDTSPLVVTEAAYFGCPTLSVRRFALPELVRDGETGILLDDPVRPPEIAAAVRSLLIEPEAYRNMRRAAFDFARRAFDWSRIGQRMTELIRARLS